MPSVVPQPALPLYMQQTPAPQLVPVSMAGPDGQIQTAYTLQMQPCSQGQKTSQPFLESGMHSSHKMSRYCLARLHGCLGIKFLKWWLKSGLDLIQRHPLVIICMPAIQWSCVQQLVITPKLKQTICCRSLAMSLTICPSHSRSDEFLPIFAQPAGLQCFPGCSTQFSNLPW